MVKFKVALSKISHLPYVESMKVRYSAIRAKTAAQKFYLKSLPKMVTIPKNANTIPCVNLWLWFVGYFKLQWPGLEKNLFVQKNTFGKPSKTKFLELCKKI